MLTYKQVQGTKQTLGINPQQIKFLNFLQLNNNELEAYVSKELEENPFLEEKEEKDVNNFTTSSKEKSTENWMQQTVAMEESFQDQLKGQLHYLKLSERLLQICEYLIDSLDDKGFFKTDIEDFLDDLSFAHNLFFEKDEITEALQIIQQLEPKGIGTKSIQEFLSSQVAPDSNLYIVLQYHFHDLSERNYEAIIESSTLSSENLEEALQQLKKLRPYPSFGYASNDQVRKNLIYPEYKIENKEGKLVCSLIGGFTKSFTFNEQYVKDLQLSKDKKAKRFMTEKVQTATWLTDAIKQREDTMVLVIHEVCRRQQDFFLSGDWQDLKPMILKDISDSLDRTISTVSRVTSTKYVECNFGILSLKSLFSESVITKDGRLISNKEIQDLVKNYIAAEDKSNPLTDKEIMTKLSHSGIDLTRRTISKYRDTLQIASSKKRRIFSS